MPRYLLFHEGGHAVAFAYYGIRVVRIDWCRTVPEAAASDLPPHERLIIAIAGPAAQKRIGPDGLAGWSFQMMLEAGQQGEGIGDALSAALAITELILPGADPDELLATAWAEAEELVAQHWHHIESIAEHMMPAYESGRYENLAKAEALDALYAAFNAPRT